MSIRVFAPFTFGSKNFSPKLQLISAILSRQDQGNVFIQNDERGPYENVCSENWNIQNVSFILLLLHNHNL